MRTARSIAEVLESLEAQAAFHEERESFHAEQEEQHREQRNVHAARLQEIRRRLEAFRAAAQEALELADETAIPAAVQEQADLGPASRPNLTRMIDLILASKRPGERFGPVTLCEEVNRRFADRLRRPFEPGQVSVALRRFDRLGRIHQVRRGRPHWEALYVREAPGS
ncbi:MAG TPA: hypothetical protein VF414_18365 [Thermoanaerobaculia bacterium]